MIKSPAAPRPVIPDLAAIRKRRGLSLEDIAEATKISVGYLRAIEEGRFERLPGGIYDLSYLRQYAQAIEYDEAELVRYYQYKTGSSPAMPTEIQADRKPRGRLPWPVSTFRNLI